MLTQQKQRCTAEDYWNLPEGVRAELIDGELWDLASPSRKHQRIVAEAARQMANYIEAHQGTCQVYPAPFAVNLFADDSTFVEPDVSVVCDPAKLSDRGCEGAPDLVIEVVSPSNPGMDYVTKLNLYREAGVREYWICDPIKERVLVYAFGFDEFPAIYDFPMNTPSAVLEGFEINYAEVVAGM